MPPARTDAEAEVGRRWARLPEDIRSSVCATLVYVYDVFFKGLMVLASSGTFAAFSCPGDPVRTFTLKALPFQMHGRGRRLKDPNVHTRNVLTWFLMGLGRHCDPVSTRAVSFLEEGGPDAVVSVHADTFTIAFAALLSEMCETHIELHPFLESIGFPVAYQAAAREIAGALRRGTMKSGARITKNHTKKYETGRKGRKEGNNQKQQRNNNSAG